MPISSQVSFFGKLPSVLDYVRIHHVSSGGIACDRWLEQSQQELARANASWPSASFRFLFPSKANDVLVGVMGPSRDRAGRRFPATLYAAVSAELVSRIGLIPWLFSTFFEQAESALVESVGAGVDALTDRLGQMPVPVRQDIEEAALERHRLLRRRRLSDLARENFAGDESCALAALKRFTLTTQAMDLSSGRSRVLCCPVHDESDVTTWLSLTEQCLSGKRAPNAWAFWSSDATYARLYVGQGEVPASLPVWLGSTRVKSERVVDVRLVAGAADAQRSETDGDGPRGESAPSLEQTFADLLHR